ELHRERVALAGLVAVAALDHRRAVAALGDDDAGFVVVVDGHRDARHRSAVEELDAVDARAGGRGAESVVERQAGAGVAEDQALLAGTRAADDLDRPADQALPGGLERRGAGRIRE